MMRRAVPVVGFVLLVVLDVVLVVLAWNHVRQDVSDARAGDRQEVIDPSATASPATPTENDRGGGTTVVGYTGAVIDGGLLARAAVHDCAEGVATIEVSEDGGRPFKEFEVPLSAVATLAAPGASDLIAVGTDDQCEAAAYASGDGGETWEPATVESAGWSVAADGGLVSSGGELTDIGCSPAAVSGVSTDVAVVLCVDGVVLRTVNGGAFWEKQTTLPFATDVAFVSETDGYVLVARGECDALVRATTDGGVTWEDGECLSAGPHGALAADGDVVVVVGADGIHRSEDRGQSWQAR